MTQTIILEPECVGCLLSQVLKSFKMLDPNTPREDIIAVQKEVMEFLVKSDLDNSSAPIVGGYFYPLIAERLGKKDPYKQEKKRYNDLALEYYDQLKELVKKAEDPLFEAIIISAIGNTIDFAAQHDMDLINDIKTFSSDDLAINDYDKFKKSIKKAKNLLIIGDNCGEIVFDKILIETIMKLYPDLEVVYSVRSIPMINDNTMEDAEYVSITEIVKVIEGSPIPGIDLNRVTKEFEKYFYTKDGLILTKGQGNFECLYKDDIGGKDLFYLLKAKCPLMERIFGVKQGSLIFKKKTKDF